MDFSFHALFTVLSLQLLRIHLSTRSNSCALLGESVGLAASRPEDVMFIFIASHCEFS